MRGDNEPQAAMYSYISPEHRVPADHPLRPLRKMTDEIFKQLSPRLDQLYSRTGRPSIAPERLLRGETAEEFFAAVLELARTKELLSDEHFTVDGTMVEGWASLKSFQPKETGDGHDTGRLRAPIFSILVGAIRLDRPVITQEPSG
jgi:transposase